MVVVSHAQIAYELVASRRSILYTSRGILAVALSRTGVVSEQRLVSLGMMRQAKLFAHNNFLNDDSLSTPVRYLLPLPSLVLADALRALHSFVRSFVRSSLRACVYLLTPSNALLFIRMQRDRSRAFHDQGKANADRAVAELMASPQFQEWKRQKEDMERWKLFGWAKHAVGTLLLAGLALYAAHLNGWIALPGVDKFQF